MARSGTPASDRDMRSLKEQLDAAEIIEIVEDVGAGVTKLLSERDSALGLNPGQENQEVKSGQLACDVPGFNDQKSPKDVEEHEDDVEPVTSGPATPVPSARTVTGLARTDSVIQSIRFIGQLIKMLETY